MAAGGCRKKFASDDVLEMEISSIYLLLHKSIIIIIEMIINFSKEARMKYANYSWALGIDFASKDAVCAF